MSGWGQNRALPTDPSRVGHRAVNCRSGLAPDRRREIVVQCPNGYSTAACVAAEGRPQAPCGMTNSGRNPLYTGLPSSGFG